MKKNILLVCFLLLTFSFGLSAEEKAEGKNTNSEVKNNSAQLKSKSDADAKPVSDFKKELPKLIVFDIKPEKGVDSGSANLLTEIVLDEVSAIFKNKYKIIGQKDIDKMLFWETNKQLKNCTESSCLMQIAGAMGAEFYVEGSVGTIGDKFVLTLKYIDALKVEILSRKTVVIEKDENRLIDSVKEVISEILNGKTLGNGANKTGRQLPEDKTKKEVVLPQPQTGIKQP
ncbi:MAG: hypothetical protein N3B13_04910, partial [Deltaproteobacteria bacterium]|nr:hypothetical protein [Deltaproteobacteria bacterium]